MSSTGIYKILLGVLQYRRTVKNSLVEQFKRIQANPSPTALFFSCMDSRMLPSRFTQTQVGEMFMVRNAGNLIPQASCYGDLGAEVSVTTEPAALDLACIRGGIKHVVVCGHSDCKAMNTLHELKSNPSRTVDMNSPFEKWLQRNGSISLRKLQAHIANPKVPLEFIPNISALTFKADVRDPTKAWCVTDILSRINVLQQLENIASHSVIRSGLEDGSINLHAMWFDVYTGEVYYFSKAQEQFILLDEDSIAALLKELAQNDNLFQRNLNARLS